MFVNNNPVSLRMRLAMIQGNIYSIFNTLKDENFQVLERLKTLCTISTKLRWCLFFYLILNRTLMLNSVKY